jgi:chromosome segregation ATPase
LENKISALKQTITSQELLIEKLNSSIKTLNQNELEYTERINNATKKIVTIDANLVTLYKEKQEAVEKAAAAESELQKATQKVADIEKENKNLLVLNSKLSSNTQRSAAEFNSLNEQLKKADNEKQTFDKQLAALRQTVTQANAAATVAESARKKSDNEKTEAAQKCEESKKELQRAVSDANLAKILAEGNENLAKKKLTELQAKLAELEKTLSNAQQELAQNKINLSDVQQELVQKKQELLDFQTKTGADVKKTIYKLSENIINLKDRIEIYKTQNFNLKNTIERLTEETETQKQKIIEFKSEKIRLKSELETLKSDKYQDSKTPVILLLTQLIAILNIYNKNPPKYTDNIKGLELILARINSLKLTDKNIYEFNKLSKNLSDGFVDIMGQIMKENMDMIEYLNNVIPVIDKKLDELQHTVGGGLVPGVFYIFMKYWYVIIILVLMYLIYLLFQPNIFNFKYMF